MHVALLQPPLSVFGGERYAVLFPLLSSSSADLFMNLGMCGFEVKPGDAVEKEANGDKTPPVGPPWDFHHNNTNHNTQRRLEVKLLPHSDDESLAYLLHLYVELLLWRYL